ncbi:MAG TPA: AAA family ATPase, partial [Gaiella sp.]
NAATRSGHAAERARHAHALLAAAERAVADEADSRLEAVRREREAVDRGMSELTGGHGDANRSLVALGAARERLRARGETVAELARTLRDQHDVARTHARSGAPSPAELEQRANESRALARAAGTERDDLAERARSARERLAALERSLAEREGVAPAARTLAAEGERLALAALEVEPGFEKAVAAALAWRASALLASSSEHALALLERARTSGLGSLSVVIGGARAAVGSPPRPDARPLASLATGADEALRLLDGVWLVEASELTEVRSGVAVTIEGEGHDADRGELWFAGETGEAVLLELEARRRVLADEADELAARAEGAALEADDASARAAEAEAAYAAVAHLRGSTLDAELLGRLAAVTEALSATTGRAVSTIARIQAPLDARIAAADRRSRELGDELRRLAGVEAEARQDAGDAGRRASEAEVVLARLGGASVGVGLAGGRTRDELAAEATGALAEADAAAAASVEAADAARLADAALVERAPRRSRLDVDLLRRLVGAASGLGASLERASALAARFEAPVRARVDAGAARAGALGGELRRLGAAEVEVRHAVDEATERVNGIEIELARLDGEAGEARRRLDEAIAGAPGVIEPDAEAAGGDDGVVDRDELAARVTRLESRREALGKVNPLAKEEYEAEKERLEELATQRADLEASLAELAALRDELTETVNRRFDETFAAVAANFEEVAATLFPGGEGRLRLVEPDVEDGAGAEPGVEVELRPAGKKITRLTLLSGGEKALGAISFLFALFLAKPCPFYLLDEVEAALDDANIARFVELLRRYADRAQFVVITHQKRTMEAADVLYGVTMGGDGVSQIVSRRLPREQHAAVSA